MLGTLGSHAEGLDAQEADALREQYGLNEVEHEQPLPWWVHLWHCYKNPFNLLLTLLAVISWLTEDMKAATVIFSMVVLSTLLRFWQEAKSNKAADALKDMVSNTATVLRREAAEPIELPIKQLVPGDLIVLSAGDMIPADCRVLSAKDLFVSQAAMTGESMPVEKFAQQKDAKTRNPLDLENILFMGTNVVSGAATAVILTTGNSTYFRRVGPARHRHGSRDHLVPAGRQQSQLAADSLHVRDGAAGVVHQRFHQGRLDRSAAVRAVDCRGPDPGNAADDRHLDVGQGRGVSVAQKGHRQAPGRDPELRRHGRAVYGQNRHADPGQDFPGAPCGRVGEESDDVLEMAYLNSYYQTGLKNLLDVAVLEHVEVHRELKVATAFQKVDEIPFDFNRRRMSVVVAEQGQPHLLICKGAVEEILSVCNRVRHGDSNEALTDELLARIRQVTAAFNEEGLRVVAVAAQPMAAGRDTYNLADEKNLTLIGYVAFLDPPKESTAPALKALKAHGVAVKVLTGDNELVTAKICREVGLEQQGLLMGNDIEDMTDAELAKAVETTNVFARLTPSHKERIVRLLKANGHVVGFMGDGINDAPALRTADIGISVDSAVDIAKEAADIILLEKSLMILEEGVLEGRRTFANMLKYIKMTASSNFGNVFSVLVASAFIPFLPMLPMHLLVQNLLYDISQIAIPFDNVDEEMLAKPQRWQPGDVGRFMLFFGPISSIFDITTFALMWYVFDANTPDHQTLFQSGWFVVGLLTQTLIVHMIRTPKIPFLQSRAAMPLMVMTGVIMAVGIFLPMGPLAHYFKLQALPSLYFVFLPVILLGYMALTQAVKGYYIRKFGWQ